MCKRFRRILVLAGTLASLTLSGCANLPGQAAKPDGGPLPAAGLPSELPQLQACTGKEPPELRADEPITVLVPGAEDQAGRFRGLARVLAFHGQQSLCFGYDRQQPMMQSAGELVVALEALADRLRHPRVTVIGYDQGGLIARKALVREFPDPITHRDLALKLVTVSAPFSGMQAASSCGSKLARRLSLGLLNLSCRLRFGEKWPELSANSAFMRAPGRLLTQVFGYLKVDTDERGSCRRADGDRCLISDQVYSLAEQRQPLVDGDRATEVLTIKAGHAEIIGGTGSAPLRLIAALQSRGLIAPTVPARRPELQELLAQLYRDTAGTLAMPAP